MPTKKKLPNKGNWTAAELQQSVGEAKMLFEAMNQEQQDFLVREAKRLNLRIYNLLILHSQRSIDDRLADEKAEGLQNDSGSI